MWTRLVKMRPRPTHKKSRNGQMPKGVFLPPSHQQVWDNSSQSPSVVFAKAQLKARLPFTGLGLLALESLGACVVAWLGRGLGFGHVLAKVFEGFRHGSSP